MLNQLLRHGWVMAVSGLEGLIWCGIVPE